MEIANALVLFSKRLYITARFTDSALTTTCISILHYVILFDVTLMDFLLHQAIGYLACSFELKITMEN